MSKQYPRKNTAAGEVKISENVIRAIAGASAREIDGVADLTPVRNGILHSCNPVSVAVINDMAEITVRIVLQSGCRLPSVAGQIQRSVKENVQGMTGVIVSRVHVIAADIAFAD